MLRLLTVLSSEAIEAIIDLPDATEPRRCQPPAPSSPEPSVYIPDVREDPEYRLQSMAQTAGFRSVVAVPMLRDGSPIGAISVSGAEPAMFSERQIAMLQTFADQAVIAIENTRLFNELQARTAELGRSVEELKALGEVGGAVSSTLDLDTVLTTILTHANQLAGHRRGRSSTTTKRLKSYARVRRSVTHRILPMRCGAIRSGREKA